MSSVAGIMLHYMRIIEKIFFRFLMRTKLSICKQNFLIKNTIPQQCNFILTQTKVIMRCQMKRIDCSSLTQMQLFFFNE